MEKRRFHRDPETISKMPTGALIAEVRVLLPEFNQDEFLDITKSYVSCEDLVNEEYFTRINSSDEELEFVYLACKELWKRLAPDRPSVEHLAEQFNRLTERAMQAAKEGSQREVVQQSEEAFRLLFPHFFEQSSSGYQLKQEFYYKFQEATAYDVDNFFECLILNLMDMGDHKRAAEIAGLLGDALGNDTYFDYKAESLFTLGRKAEAERCYRELIMRHPDNPRYALHAGDCYLTYGQEDYARAKGFYLKALEAARKNRFVTGDDEDIDAVYQRLIDLADDMGEFDESLRYQQLLNDSLRTASGQKVGRNEPCPCGSGKKYKECCLGKDFTWVKDDRGNISRQVSIDDPEMESLIDQARADFSDQQNRDPEGSDIQCGQPMDEEDLEKTITDIMEQAGIDPAFIYAFQKTGRIVTAWNQNKLTGAELREWQEAIKEYRVTSGCDPEKKDNSQVKRDLKESVYQLKVTLMGSKPPIWRRCQVSGNVTLQRLHLILQDVMGWTNSHLYLFEISGTEYGIPDQGEDDFNELHFADSRRARLGKVVPCEKARFTYMYDYGDSWEHLILVEKILPAQPGTQYPVCLAGKRAGPPEDSGGIPGYEELLDIILDPAHEEYESMMEWLGGSFDPEEYDLDRVNRLLRRHHKRSRVKRTAVPEVFRRAFESEDKSG